MLQKKELIEIKKNPIDAKAVCGNEEQHFGKNKYQL